MERINNREESLRADQPQSTEFVIGQLVALRSNPARFGAVISILPGLPENRYLVFIDNKSSTYYASQLQAYNQIAPSHELTPLSVFHAYMTALQLNHPSLATLYSLNAARVTFVPYQYRPILKFIHSDRPRLLIADEVGVGKTIEAGLILRELQARKDMHSVLIICPKPLVTERKWQIEMKRFDEQFVHLDGPTLRHCIKETDLDGVWPEQFTKAILPFSLFNQELLTGTYGKRNRNGMIGLRDLDPPPHFDLVIVDEAHHLRNTDTAIHQGVRYFCEQAEAGGCIIFCVSGQPEEQMKRKMEGERDDHSTRIDRRIAQRMRRSARGAGRGRADQTIDQSHYRALFRDGTGRASGLSQTWTARNQHRQCSQRDQPQEAQRNPG